MDNDQLIAWLTRSVRYRLRWLCTRRPASPIHAPGAIVSIDQTPETIHESLRLIWTEVTHGFYLHDVESTCGVDRRDTLGAGLRVPEGQATPGVSTMNESGWTFHGFSLHLQAAPHHHLVKPGCSLPLASSRRRRPCGTAAVADIQLTPC